MEMNPFKPIIQFCEEFYEKRLSVKISIEKFYFKLSKVKALT